MIFRPHNVYGPRQNIGDRYRNVIGIFMNQILQGQPMTIFGDGTQTRAFSYIDDVAPVIAAAIDVAGAWNQVFNVGADRPWTLNELASAVATAMGVTPQIVHLAARHEVAHAHSSHEKVAARVRRCAGDTTRRRAARDGCVGPAARRPRAHRRSRGSRSRATCRRRGSTMSGRRATIMPCT